jgi:hypothetical protein
LQGWGTIPVILMTLCFLLLPNLTLVLSAVRSVITPVIIRCLSSLYPSPLPSPDTGTHRRLTRGGHWLSKVSCRPIMLHRSTPCGQATTEMALRPFQEWPPARWVACGGLLTLWTPHDTLYAYANPAPAPDPPLTRHRPKRRGNR